VEPRLPGVAKLCIDYYIGINHVQVGQRSRGRGSCIPRPVFTFCNRRPHRRPHRHRPRVTGPHQIPGMPAGACSPSSPARLAADEENCHAHYRMVLTPATHVRAYRREEPMRTTGWS
jgi:hypothetical protein